MTKVMRGVSFYTLNGRMTNAELERRRLVKNKTLSAYGTSYYWSSSEYNANNAWNVNFSSGNVNNNNKNKSFTIRPVTALDDKRKEAWLDAFDDCCRHKRMSDSCIRYRLIYEEDLFRLAEEVESGIYGPSTSICFCVTRPKVREVFASNFRDRIVHHWLMMKLNKALLGLNSYVGFTAHTNNYGKRLSTLLKYRRMYRYVYLKSRLHVIKVKKQFNIEKKICE